MKTYERLSEIRKDLTSGTTSCVSLVEFYLGQIEAHQHLNCYLEVYAEEARRQAAAVDEKVAAGTAGKLAGLVVGLKDTIVYKDHGATAASQILNGFESVFSATAVQRLLAEDAIIIGRHNCDEFAMGSSNENSSVGPVKNPHNPACVPGGSSGGSAAAVAANLCHAALGSDTGGSIRQPAAFCGVVGLKPTYGRVSRSGLIAYASSFDQIGPITRSVEDAARIYEVIGGPDEHDATTSSRPMESFSPEEWQAEQPFTIGVIRETMESEGLQPEIKAAMEARIEALQAAGHSIAWVDFPYLDYLVPTYYILTTAEASSNLARYDGVRLGNRAEGVENSEELFYETRTQGFGPEVKRRIMLGTFVLSAGYYDAYYTKGMQVRRVIQQKTREMLQQFDFLLSPTTPTTAFGLGAKAQDPIAMYLSDIFTVHANLSGTPAITLPGGTLPDGLPFGIQLLGNYFKEDSLFHLATQLEANTNTITNNQ